MKYFSKLNVCLGNLKTKYNEEHIFGIFLYGKEKVAAAVVVPTFEDICLNRALINEVYKDIKVIDVRFLYRATQNGFPEIIESLYTDYYIVNPRYEYIYTKLFRANREKFKEGINKGIPPEELKIAVIKIMQAILDNSNGTISFIKQLTDIEKTALETIVNSIGGEGVISQAKVASAAGISRAALTKLILKMQLSGVAEIQYLGNKGTFIKIFDDVLLNIRA